MSLRIECHGLTDRGLVRVKNEDHFLTANLSRSCAIELTSLPQDQHHRLFQASQGKLLVVADGMGGRPEGEKASQFAAEWIVQYVLHLMPWFYRLHEPCEEDFAHELKSGIELCQQWLFEWMQESGLEGTGTTLTAAYVVWPRLFVVHVGDSRCYLFRDGQLQQLTRDHTVAQQLVDSGVLKESEVQSSRWSHVLWNVIGGNSTEISPDVHKLQLQSGDELLLCTDGLTKHITNERIGEVLRETSDVAAATTLLLKDTLMEGGSDNTTIVAARFLEDGPSAENLTTAELLNSTELADSSFS